jgi:hypothetical protein
MAKKESSEKTRTRASRPYPASSFKDALQLAEAIMKHGSGEKVRRLTLLQKMDKSPNSGPTKQMITNSGKYELTTGSYAAEYFELTPKGRLVVDNAVDEKTKRQAKFDLSIAGVEPFNLLYEQYKGKRLPVKEIIKDVLKDSGLTIPDHDECIDTFIVNAKDLELLQTIGGAETLIPIEQALDELPESKGTSKPSTFAKTEDKQSSTAADTSTSSAHDWDKICFYITPIGEENSEQRKHSDLFISSIVQPALDELGLKVIRADQIGEPGMITTQVLEYLKLSKLAIADLSYLNPNVFYEVALRHALRLPVVQIIRKADRLPFDVNQLRTLVFDTTDIYSLIPRLQTYRSEIANQSRKAIEDPESVGNPVSVFYPAFYK